jgi:hypothetical protein
MMGNSATTMHITRWKIGRHGTLRARAIRRAASAFAVLVGFGLLTTVIPDFSSLHAESRPLDAQELAPAPQPWFLDFPQTGTGVQLHPEDSVEALPLDPTLIVPLPSDPVANQAPVTGGVFDPGPAARPFSLRGLSSMAQFRAGLCLTSAIYYEAANEPDDGQRAVAQVVLNRVKHPSYPNSVCDVVYQGSERMTGCQFSFSCDGSMARVPARAAWARARQKALEALNGYVYAPVGLATHYHTLAVSPYWGPSLRKAAIVGAHIFYRWPGNAGEANAFSARYAGFEPYPGPHPRAATPAPATDMAAASNAYPALPLPKGHTARTNGDLGLQPQWSAPPVRTVATDNRYLPGALPESTIRDKYRDSGQWIAR